MKKAITILAVLIVLVGAVFAAETHKIKIKADVTEQLPTFQMYYSAYTNTGKVAFDATQTYYDQTGYDTNFNLDSNGSVTVSVIVNNTVAAAKTNKAFKLSFSDGVFTVSRNGVEGTHAPSSITTTAKSATTGIKSIGYDYTMIANPDYDADEAEAQGEAYDVPATIADQSVTNNPVVVTFNGTTMTDSTYEVATAQYSYTGDSRIDPNLNGSFYYADIVLGITTL